MARQSKCPTDSSSCHVGISPHLWSRSLPLSFDACSYSLALSPLPLAPPLAPSASPTLWCVRVETVCQSCVFWCQIWTLARHTWFDRPLGLAGKVVVREGGEESKKLVEKLVRINRPIMMIPNLAVHLQTADERKAFSVNPETHLQPVICSQLFDEEVREESHTSSCVRTRGARCSCGVARVPVRTWSEKLVGCPSVPEVERQRSINRF